MRFSINKHFTFWLFLFESSSMSASLSLTLSQSWLCFLTVYLKNWEYSQVLYQRKHSRTTAVRPPPSSLSLPLFIFFPILVLGSKQALNRPVLHRAGLGRAFLLQILAYTVSDNCESILKALLMIPQSPSLFGFRGKYSLQTSCLFLAQTIVFVLYLHNSEGGDPSVKYFFQKFGWSKTTLKSW